MDPLDESYHEFKSDKAILIAFHIYTLELILMNKGMEIQAFNRKWIKTSNRSIKGGGQGRIFNVTNADNDGQYILKEVKFRREQDRKRFRQEVDTLSAIKGHKNIIVLFDFCETQEEGYIVIEKADTTLDEFIRNNKLSFDRKLFIFFQILNAIEHLHDYNRIHRDLKPKNILIKGKTIKIIDFGISFNLERKRQKRITQSWERVGSYYFMAPEFENGLCTINDGRSDIYSLGKILYFILSDGVIFNREAFEDKEFDLSEKIDFRFQSFNRFFKKCINSLPESRFKNIPEMKDGLVSCLNELFYFPIMISRGLNVNESDLSIYSECENLADLSYPMICDWFYVKTVKDHCESNLPFIIEEEVREGEFFAIKIIYFADWSSYWTEVDYGTEYYLHDYEEIVDIADFIPKIINKWLNYLSLRDEMHEAIRRPEELINGVYHKLFWSGECIERSPFEFFRRDLIFDII